MLFIDPALCPAGKILPQSLHFCCVSILLQNFCLGDLERWQCSNVMTMHSCRGEESVDLLNFHNKTELLSYWKTGMCYILLVFINLYSEEIISTVAYKNSSLQFSFPVWYPFTSVQTSKNSEWPIHHYEAFSMSTACKKKKKNQKRKSNLQIRLHMPVQANPFTTMIYAAFAY